MKNLHTYANLLTIGLCIGLSVAQKIVCTSTNAKQISTEQVKQWHGELDKLQKTLLSMQKSPQQSLAKLFDNDFIFIRDQFNMIYNRLLMLIPRKSTKATNPAKSLATVHNLFESKRAIFATSTSAQQVAMLKAIQSAIEKFERESSQKLPHDLSLTLTGLALQLNRLISRITTAPKEKNKIIVYLVKQYVAQLEKYVPILRKAGKVGVATVVSNNIKSILNSKETNPTLTLNTAITLIEKIDGILKHL